MSGPEGRACSLAPLQVDALGPLQSKHRCICFPSSGGRGGWEAVGGGPSPCPSHLSSLESHVVRGRSTTRNVTAKKKDTIVLSKLFWLEHFQLGSRHIHGLPSPHWPLATPPCSAQLGALLFIVV